jgi:hypothetical protein
MAFNKDPRIIVYHLIDHYIDSGLTDKTDIYSKIVEQTGMKRPEVRKYAREYRVFLLEKIKILQSEGSKSLKNIG